MMENKVETIREILGLYRVILLNPLRRTENVYFDTVPMNILGHIDAIDRVIHHHGAISPGPVGDVERPWYYHPHQDDNLMVLNGTRYVDLYTPEHGKIERFIVAPNKIENNGKLICAAPAMLVWPKNIFHRVRSGDNGSASVNFAVHHQGFDIRTNFNIFDLNTETGFSKVIREGHSDQFPATKKK
jgi:hypothetical protein